MSEDREQAVTQEVEQAKKPVMTHLDISDIELLDRVAKERRLSRSSLMREVLMAYVIDYLAFKGTNRQKVRLEVPLGEVPDMPDEQPVEVDEIEEMYEEVIISHQPIDEIEEEKPQPVQIVEPGVVYGPPKACLVCNAVTNQIGQAEISIVNSGADWGVWGCHACSSNGRWYESKPSEILVNTRVARS